MSTPLPLKLLPGRMRATRRSGAPAAHGVAALFGAAMADPVREPEGLQVPMTARARRLMRYGRVNGW